MNAESCNCYCTVDNKIMAECKVLENEIHLWFASLDVPNDERESFARILSPDEIARANRFHFPQHRRRFMVARGRLRQILGNYLEIKPETVSFLYSDRGKPSIADPLQFNVSHSGDMAVYGLRRQGRIGVDVEEIRSIKDLEDLTKRFFCAREHELIQHCGEKARVFFQLWTGKEAYLKAIGMGIGGGLDRVEVSIDPLSIRNVEGEWHLWSCQPKENFIATIAIEGEDGPVKTFDLSGI
jgi:4'-phosphopantetheinyl transferase